MAHQAAGRLSIGTLHRPAGCRLPEQRGNSAGRDARRAAAGGLHHPQSGTVHLNALWLYAIVAPVDLTAHHVGHHRAPLNSGHGAPEPVVHQPVRPPRTSRAPPGTSAHHRARGTTPDARQRAEPDAIQRYQRTSHTARCTEVTQPVTQPRPATADDDYSQHIARAPNAATCTDSAALSPRHTQYMNTGYMVGTSTSIITLVIVYQIPI